MPPLNPMSAVGPTNTLSGQVLRFILDKLEDGDRERFLKSFQEAAEWCSLTPEQQAERSKGGTAKVWQAIKKAPSLPRRGIKRIGKRWRTEQTGPIAEGNGAHEAFEQVAHELNEAWAGDLSGATWLNDRTEGTWTSFLTGCLRRVAQRGAKEPAWRYAIGGNSEVPVKAAAIDAWAAAMTRKLVSLWNRDRRLAIVKGQLEAESGLGLQNALVAVSREMSRRLLWIALAVLGAALAGGGGIALLVLLIDQG